MPRRPHFIREIGLGFAVSLSAVAIFAADPATPNDQTILKRSGGSVTVPFDKVWLKARNVAEAYDVKVKELVNPTASDHLDLARWCLENDLVAQAESEVEQALLLEPRRSDARELFDVIDARKVARKRKVEPRPTTNVGPAAAIERIFQEKLGGASADDGPRRAISGLPTAITQDYILHVQPLLSNKCGNAACHGPSADSSFKLASTRGDGHHKLASEANLRELLRYTDPEAANLTRILRDCETTSPHATLFRGPKGDEHWELIKNWIEQAGQEQLAAKPPKKSRRAVENMPAGQITRITPTAAEQPAVVRTKPSVEQAGGTREGTDKEPVEVVAPLKQRAMDEIRSDPFDPKIFNRKIHGRW